MENKLKQMLKKISPFLIILFCIAATDALFFFIEDADKKRVVYDVLYFTLVSFEVLLFLAIAFKKIIYNYHGKAAATGLLFAALFIVSMVISNRMMALNNFYLHSKKSPLFNSGNIWRSDPLLSYKGVACADGFYGFQAYDSVSYTCPVKLDSNGYRIAEKKIHYPGNKEILFLGCSFTFGDYVKAEESFAYKTAQLLRHNYTNAASSGYGLGQMQHLSDNLLKKNKYNYVFIQLSPWLAERSMGLKRSRMYGYRATPYFTRAGSSGFKLVYPVYNTRMVNRKFIRNTPASYYEKIRFSLQEGYDVEVADYFTALSAQWKVNLGLLPPPADNKREVEAFFYRNIIKKVKSSGATPVILKLRYADKECAPLLNEIKKQATVIDLDLALDSVALRHHTTFEQLLTNSKRHNGVRVQYDNHPNAMAHRIMAKYIYTQLQQEKKSGRKMMKS